MTPGPTSSTTPEMSAPRITGGSRPAEPPSTRNLVSTRLTDEAKMRTNTSPGPGSGLSTSLSSKRLGTPNSGRIMARIGTSFLWVVVHRYLLIVPALNTRKTAGSEDAFIERWTALTEWSLKNVSGAETLRISIQGLYSCGECHIALRWLFCVYYQYLNSAYNAGGMRTHDLGNLKGDRAGSVVWARGVGQEPSGIRRVLRARFGDHWFNTPRGVRRDSDRGRERKGALRRHR